MVMQLKARILIFILFNILLITLLYNIPINSKDVNTICIYKNITGKDCWNCGMTRAFLSILHLDFYTAYQFNNKVIIVFPLIVGNYLYGWYKYIFYERRCLK